MDAKKEKKSVKFLSDHKSVIHTQKKKEESEVVWSEA